MASGSEPPYLPIGTDVSAKYRGAFCEARVKKIVKSVKVRVFLKDTQSTALVTDEEITGPLKMGATVEVKNPDSGRVVEGVIKHMMDSSMYTVVFDDADERTLRRTQLCLKGDKHFTESETLDNLPLSNPEHFGTPVIAKGKRIRTSAGVCEQDESDESTDEEGSPRRKIYRGGNQDLVGKIMFYDSGERKKANTLVPVLVCVPDAHNTELKTKDHLLVKSFKDGKFFSVMRKELVLFTREAVLKNEDKMLKPAMEKALLYIDNSELPLHWNREELIGSDDEEDDEETSEDDEQSEEKDRFVAQLYKFSDDRGTPINKGPCIGSKDLDLFRLFKVVQSLGGYNRVTNQMKWRLVYSKMLLPPSNTASTQIKNAYKKYLLAFEDFYRKLGSSMGTISRPSRVRHGSGRSIMNFRDKEKTSEKTDSDKEKTGDDNKSEFDSDAESISKPSTPGTPKRAKSARVKLDLKESKDTSKDDKKDEKPEVKKEEKDTKRSEESSRKGKKTIEDKKDKKSEMKEESEKKGSKKKDDGTQPVTPKKKDNEEELKDLQKKISRRRSARMDEKNEEEDVDDTKKEDVKTDESAKETKETKKDKKEEKKDDTKDKKKEDKEEKKKEVEEKIEKKPRRREVKKRNTQNDSDESDGDTSTTSVNTSDLPAGTKMKVKYGRGRNAREYEAKILEVGTDPGPRQYLVHYQGWNNRHDEWIKVDRIVKVLERPDGSGKKLVQKPSPKPGLKGPKKKTLIEKQPASPSSVKSDSSTSQAPGRSSKSIKQQTQSSSNGSTVTPPASKGRPTRSNSIESKISEGLPAKRRAPKAPSINESGQGSDSENSDKSDNESEADKKPEVDEKEGLPTPSLSSTSMPLIISKKTEEDELEVDPNEDRSPPKLCKVTDITKEKGEMEESPEQIAEKVEIKEEPVAPVLKVESEKNSEPILQKMEAQLNASTAVKSSAIVNEDKEKETKKKDVESRRVKKTVKDKSEVESSPKKSVEKTMREDKSHAKEIPSIENKSTCELKDEPENKLEIEVAESKKQEEILQQKTHTTEKSMDISKDDSSVVAKISDEEMGKTKPNLMVEEKEAAKSDSEVEKRGRKKKTVNKEDGPRDAKKAKVTTVENKILDAPNLIEKKVVNVPAERKPFVTLAEKKQGFSPIVRKVPIIATEKCSQPETNADNISDQLMEKDKVENKEEIKKRSEMVVVHKESSIKSDIVVGRKTEIASREEVDHSKLEDAGGKDEQDESLIDSQTVKKKVRKKTKKKSEGDSIANVVKKTVKTRALSAKVKESVRKIRDTHKLSEDESAVKESAIDIDLRCEESIRSRSASPELVENTSSMSHPESQGFEFFVETVTSQLHESQQSSSGIHLRDDKSKSVKNVFENTPPTTPEHDSDEASQLNSQSDQIKVNNKVSNKELGTKLDTGHNEGHESPRGNVSPSSNGSGGSSGVVAGSEGSVDVPVHNNKRRRESEENTPSKRRKRASRGKSAASRARQIAESDTDEASNMSLKCRSPHYHSDSYPSKPLQNTTRSPRPLKYNFNLEEGKYLEGNERISFLIDKIQEIRKIYMNLKSEVASIDRRRKKLRRREKESKSHTVRGVIGASSSAVEVECS